MPTLHQYDYIFAICIMAAGLDAYNIGANDVSNTFGPAVSSRALSLRQAVILASITEFAGAVLCGARVAGTLKNNIVSMSAFGNDAGVQMLGMTCALVASASWLMFCTIRGWPVSTTYSLVAAISGMGIALAGPQAPQWGWNNGKGLGAIFAGFGLAPAISGAISIVLYLIIKYAVLMRKDSFKAGLTLAPFLFFFVSGFMTLTVLFGSGTSLGLQNLGGTTVAVAVVVTGAVIGLLSAVFWVPYIYCKVQRKDHTLRFYHIALGPLLWRRPSPILTGEELQAAAAVPDYGVHGRRAAEQHDDVDEKIKDVVDGGESASVPTKIIDGEEYVLKSAVMPPALAEVERDASREIVGAWILPRNLWIILRYKIPSLVLHGSQVDVYELQAGDGDKEKERIRAMHAQAKQYPNETEHLFSLMQVLTCAVASFSHGAGDVSNAVAPLAAVHYAWQMGEVTPSSSGTPIWVLAFGGAMICVGLATYGYRIMSVMGNRLTMHSPSRSVAISLGAAITTLLAAQVGIPASSTMAICGSTAGVGVVSSGWRSLNYKMFGWIVLGWIVTLPASGTLSGVLLGLFINAPRPA